MPLSRLSSCLSRLLSHFRQRNWDSGMEVMGDGVLPHVPHIVLAALAEDIAVGEHLEGKEVGRRSRHPVMHSVFVLGSCRIPHHCNRCVDCTEERVLFGSSSLDLNTGHNHLWLPDQRVREAGRRFYPCVTSRFHVSVLVRGTSHILLAALAQH